MSASKLRYVLPLIAVLIITPIAVFAAGKATDLNANALALANVACPDNWTKEFQGTTTGNIVGEDKILLNVAKATTTGKLYEMIAKGCSFKILRGGTFMAEGGGKYVSSYECPMASVTKDNPSSNSFGCHGSSFSPSGTANEAYYVGTSLVFENNQVYYQFLANEGQGSGINITLMVKK